MEKLDERGRAAKLKEYRESHRESYLLVKRAFERAKEKK